MDGDNEGMKMVMILDYVCERRDLGALKALASRMPDNIPAITEQRMCLCCLRIIAQRHTADTDWTIVHGFLEALGSSISRQLSAQYEKHLRQTKLYAAQQVWESTGEREAFSQAVKEACHGDGDGAEQDRQMFLQVLNGSRQEPPPQDWWDSLLSMVNCAEDNLPPSFLRKAAPDFQHCGETPFGQPQAVQAYCPVVSSNVQRPLPSFTAQELHRAYAGTDKEWALIFSSQHPEIVQFAQQV